MQSSRPAMLTSVTSCLTCIVDKVSYMNLVKRNRSQRGDHYFSFKHEFNTSKMLSACANACCEEHNHPDQEMSGTTNLLLFTHYEYYQGDHQGSFWGFKAQNRLARFELSTQTANRTKNKSIFLLGRSTVTEEE